MIKKSAYHKCPHCDRRVLKWKGRGKFNNEWEDEMRNHIRAKHPNYYFVNLEEITNAAFFSDCMKGVTLSKKEELLVDSQKVRDFCHQYLEQGQLREILRAVNEAQTTSEVRKALRPVIDAVEVFMLREGRL